MGLDLLSNHKGDCLFLLDGYPTRIATGHTADHVIVQLAAGKGVGAPWQVREQPTEQPEQAETGQNSPEQPSTPSREQQYTERNPLVVRGFHAEQTVEQLKQHNLAINAARPPTIEESAAIQSLHQIFPSIHKTVFAAYGHYNGKVRAYVMAALNGHLDDDGETPDETLPTTIDLTTEAGRATLSQLQASGLIQWPDPTSMQQDQ